MSYDVNIDLGNRNTSHTQVVELVGTGKRVLDVGCWAGDLGRVLVEQRCTVAGVEIDEEAAKAASEALDEVVVADIEAAPLSSLFEAASFDVLVFADVLEHLKDPVAVLDDARALLKPDGYFVVSIPNVAHGSVRLALLQGRWRYTDTGLLDRTHVRFFNREGLGDLTRDAGLVVDTLRGTVADPLDVDVEVDPKELPSQAVEWVREQPDGLIYQFQFRARPAGDDEDTSRLPELQPAADPGTVRRTDEHTERFFESRRGELRMRDHVLGLHAEMNQVREGRRKARQRASELRTRLQRVRAERDSLRRRVGRLQRRVAKLEAELAVARRQDFVRRAARRLVRR